jgi:hypothetical protein
MPSQEICVAQESFLMHKNRDVLDPLKATLTHNLYIIQLKIYSSLCY